MNAKLAFFKESVKNIKTTGTVMPSSRFLITKMLKGVDFEKSLVFVEYGAGNGIITKYILKKMKPDAKLICFEINTEFNKHLNLINDDRLIIVNNSAEKIKAILSTNNIQNVDCFVSSLPLAIMPLTISENILNYSKEVLNTNGQFIQYQYSTNSLKIFKKFFGKKNVILNFELMNIPPAFIYKCKKTNPLK